MTDTTIDSNQNPENSKNFLQKVQSFLLSGLPEGVNNPYSLNDANTKKPWFATVLIEIVGIFIMLAAFYMSIEQTMHFADSDIVPYIWWGMFLVLGAYSLRYQGEDIGEFRAAMLAARDLAPFFSFIFPYALLATFALQLRFTVDTTYLIPVEIVSMALAVIYFIRLKAINNVQSKGSNKYDIAIYVVMGIIAVKSIFMFAGGLDDLGLLIFAITGIQILIQQSLLFMISNQNKEGSGDGDIITNIEIGSILTTGLGIWFMELSAVYWVVFGAYIAYFLVLGQFKTIANNAIGSLMFLAGTLMMAYGSFDQLKEAFLLIIDDTNLMLLLATPAIYVGFVFILQIVALVAAGDGFFGRMVGGLISKSPIKLQTMIKSILWTVGLFAFATIGKAMEIYFSI